MNRVIVISMLAFLMLLTFPSHAGQETYWPSFRGPDYTGVAPDADPPLTWSETENVKWKVELPGEGLSSPVVWGNKIFFLTAIKSREIQPSEPEPSEEQGGRRGRGRKPNAEYKFDVVCVDRTNGKRLWQTTVKEAVPHEGHHGDASFASYSPVTDGKFVWANFGSRGLHCLDVDGNLKWSRDLVQQRIRAGFGEGSSAAVAGNAVVVVTDNEDQSYIFAFDKVSGQPLWKKERDEATGWATPLPLEVNGKIQVVVNGTNFVRAYDSATGDVIWKCSGQTANAIPTPVAGLGKVFCTSGFRGAALFAIDPTKTGDISDTEAVIWKISEATPYVPSPILIKDKIYVCAGNNAEISCYQAEDGKPNYVKQTVEGVKGVYASLVGAQDRIYLAGRNGATAVLKVSDTLEVLATNTLDNKIDATPAIVGDEIFIKTSEHLYCIAEK